MAKATPSVADIQGVVSASLYGSEQQPRVADIKQILDTLKDHVQPLTPDQVRAVGYLEYLQSRPLHGKNNKVYDPIIKRIIEDAPKVAPPSFYIRVIEALIPRATYIDGKAAQKMARESDGKE